MRMTSVEKWFVNRVSKGLDNNDRVLRQMRDVGIPPGRDLLEIGCGIGVVSAALAWEGHRVTATDIDAEQIRTARAMHPEGERLRFLAADAASLDFDDASFDVVVTQNALHHIPRWPDVVTEIGRVLRVGGYVFLLDLAIPPLLRGAAGMASRVAGVYTARELSAAFEQSGMTQRRMRSLVALDARIEAVFQRVPA